MRKRPILTFLVLAGVILAFGPGCKKAPAPDPAARFETPAKAILALVPAGRPAHLRYRTAQGATGPHTDLAKTLASLDPSLGQIVSAIPLMEGALPNLTEVTILPAGAWSKAGCSIDHRWREMVLSRTDERFLEYSTKDAEEIDLMIGMFDRKALAEGFLAPGFPYRVELAWPHGCPGLSGPNITPGAFPSINPGN